jgi:hypothetical protein
VKPVRFTIAAGLAWLLACGAACDGRVASRSGAGPATAAAQDRAATAKTTRSTMNVHIKLRDGFRDGDVTIRWNGKEVYRKAGVTTDLTISYADAVDVAAGEGPATLEVAVAGGASASATIDPAQTPFVDVWVDGGRMELRALAAEQPML